jgi:hypothetical protein
MATKRLVREERVLCAGIMDAELATRLAGHTAIMMSGRSTS